jgi:regulation of enolase protein 1 (concanavalin A-like superfamily)
MAAFGFMLGLVFGFNAANTVITALGTVGALVGSLAQLLLASGQKAPLQLDPQPPKTPPRPAGERGGSRPWLVLATGLVLVALLGGALALARKPSDCVPGFSDKFNGLLDRRWIWISRQGTAALASSSHGTVHMTAPNSSDLLPNLTNAPRLMQLIGGNFTVETHLIFAPSAAYQGAGLLLWQDSSNYVRLELGFGGFRGIEFTAAIKSTFTRMVGVWSYYGRSLPTQSDDVSLRLQRKGDEIRAWWRDPTDGTAWRYVGQKSIHLDHDLQVGVAVVNVSNLPSAAADYDYFHFACA